MEEAELATTTPVRLDARLRAIDELRTSTPMYDAVIDEVNGRELRIGGHWLVDWASCNYLGLDHLKGVGGVSGDADRPDNIIFDITGGVSTSGFGHPHCLFDVAVNTLPAVQ